MSGGGAPGAGTPARARGGDVLGLGSTARSLREAAWRGGPGAVQRVASVLRGLGPDGAAAALAEECAESGWTALHCALFFGRLDLARELLAHGARPDAPDAAGRTPLDLLAAEIRPLLSKGRGSLRGEVVAWGNGANYQLGTGTVGVQECPVRVEDLRGCAVEAVEAGKFHSCALDRDGRLWTWGHGRGGRLGHPDFDVHSGQVAVIAPRRVLGFPQGRRVLAVAAAKHHTAAVCEGGSVWTWGSNRDGQLGYAGVDSQPTPRQVRDVRGRAVGVSAANRHTATVTADGEVFTWGANGHGQLGYGTSDASGNGVPRLIEALRGRHVHKLSASKRHTACVTADGDVLVWGQQAVMPRRVHLPELSGARGVKFHRGLTDVRCPVAVDVAAGAAHSTVLTLGGVPMVWRSADPLLQVVEVPLPEGMRGANVSAGKERTAVMTKCGNLYVWEGKPKALEAALKRDAGGVWSGPKCPELLGQIRHAAGVAVGEKHSLCLQQAYQPPLPETMGGGVPSLHVLAQRTLMEHVADAHNALALSEISGDLQAAELKLFCQRLALGNLDLLVAANDACLGAVSAECVEDLVRMSRGSHAVKLLLEDEAEEEGGDLLHYTTATPHDITPLGDALCRQSLGKGGFFERATAPSSNSPVGAPHWPESRHSSRQGSLQGALEPSFSDAGRSVWDREESERLGRNLRKKLQQIESLKQLAAERGDVTLDDQQRAKLERKAELQSALFLLEEGTVPLADVASLIGASASRHGQSLPPPPAVASTPPVSLAPGGSNNAERKISKKKGKRKHKKGLAPAAARASDGGSTLSLSFEGGHSWADIPAALDAVPLWKLPSREGGSMAGSHAIQDNPLCSACSPPAGPRTPPPLENPSVDAIVADTSLASYNYAISPLSSVKMYPELNASLERPPLPKASTTHRFYAGGSAGMDRQTPRKTPSKRREGALSMFLQGGLDEPSSSEPTCGDGYRTNWGKRPIQVPCRGETRLRYVREQEERPGDASRGGRAAPSLSSPASLPWLAKGRAVLGDFIDDASRRSFGSSPHVWGGTEGGLSTIKEPKSFQDLQAEALELQNRRLQSYGGSPVAGTSPLLVSSPSQWYCPESETSIAKGLLEIQSEEAQALAAQEAGALEAAEIAAALAAVLVAEAAEKEGQKPHQGRKRREAAEKSTTARGTEREKKKNTRKGQRGNGGHLRVGCGWAGEGRGGG